MRPCVHGLQGRFMALDFQSDPLAELSAFWGLGVDGVFVDCPSTAREWLAAAGLQRQGASGWLPYGLRLPGTMPPRAAMSYCEGGGVQGA